MSLVSKVRDKLILSNLVLCGFKYKSAKNYLDYKKTKHNQNCSPFSTKEIFSILPFNGLYEKSLEDGIAIRLSLSESSEIFLKQFFYKDKRDGEDVFCPLADAYSDGHEDKSLLEFLKDSKSFEVVNCEKKQEYSVFEYANGSIKKNGHIIEEREFNEYLKLTPRGSVIREFFKAYDTLNICILNLDGNTPEIIEKYGNVLLYTNELADTSLRIAHELPEIEYLNITIGFSGYEWKILKIDTGIDLVSRKINSDKLIDFISSKLEKHSAQIVRNLPARLARYSYALISRKKGFLGYMYANWRRGVKEDFKNSHKKKSLIRKAHRRGFYSYRIEQYGMTDENYKNFLSDYDYKRLRPLNCKYSKLLENKLSLSHVMNRYNDFFPEYYFYIIKRDTLRFIRTNFCHYSYNCDANGIIQLLVDKKELAMKPVVGSHGKGFLKLEYKKGKYSVNDKQLSLLEIETLINSIDRDYVVSEFVHAENELEMLYPAATCTVRLMVLNKSGKQPIIEDAYIRIGTSLTGHTDNITSGGIVASIDKDTGHYYNALRIINHRYEKCNIHPDTNKKIDGDLTDWKFLKDTVTNIAKQLSPLEYLGFDVVVKDRGFKILEINTHQDLHRYPSYNDNVKSYFNRKLAERKLI